MSELRERARRERIRILLRTRNDYLPSLRARATPYTVAGPAPGRKRKCPACDGTGKTRLRQQCPVCEGKRLVEVDSYVGRVTASDARKPEPMSAERREEELQRLKASIDLSAGRHDPEEKYGWERARETRDKQGSYVELERALEWLRDTHFDEWVFLLGVYNYPRKLSRAAEVRSDEIIGLLSMRMPSRIRLPRRLHAELMERKRKRATALLKEGLDPSAVAAAVLLPKALVAALGK